MSCEDPNPSQELKSACDCQKSVKTFVDLAKSYEASKAAHAAAKVIYDKEWSKYQNDLRDWQSKKANKRKELVDQTKIWNNCVLWTGVYGHDDWCQSDTGFGRQTGAGGYGCWDGQGKGVCQRTEYQVNEELNKWQGSNPPPIPPPGGTNGNVTPCGESCNPPTGNIIQCCSNIMSGDAFVENTQLCLQSIEQKIIDITNSPSAPSTTVSSTPEPSPSAPIIVPQPSGPMSYTPETVPSKTNSSSITNIWITLFLISVLVMLIWCSIILSFLII